MCPKCGGLRFVIVERNGVEGAEPCPCSIAKKQPGWDIEPTEREYMEQALVISRHMPCFPQDEITIRGLARHLAALAVNREQLYWLIETLPQAFDEWPGFRSVREYFCTRYEPRDKRGPDLLDAGAAEMRAIERVGDEFRKQLGDLRKEMALHPAEYEPLEIEPGAAEQPTNNQNPDSRLKPRLGPMLIFEGSGENQGAHLPSTHELEEQLEKDKMTGDKRTPEEEQQQIEDLRSRLKERHKESQDD